MNVKRVEPQAGQESVWDYHARRGSKDGETSGRSVGGVTLAEDADAFRVLETSHPPVYISRPVVSR